MAKRLVFQFEFSKTFSVNRGLSLEFDEKLLQTRLALQKDPVRYEFQFFYVLLGDVVHAESCSSLF